MILLWKFFAFGFSALLPVVNPLGSALVFLGLVGIVPPEVYRSLARRIAINTILFFAVIEFNWVSHPQFLRHLASHRPGSGRICAGCNGMVSS